MDGGGPSPSFYWGQALAPDLGEYYGDKAHFDRIFFLPCAIVAAVFTTFASGVAGMVPGTQQLTRFATSGVGTLTLCIFAILVSDFGSVRGWWSGPIVFLGGRPGVREIWLLVQVLLPPAMGSGALAVSWGLLRPK